MLQLSKRTVHKVDFKAPRLPIILCHGLFGYSVLQVPFIQLRYWRGIQDSLQQYGCTVASTSVGSVSSLKQRAEQLHHFLTLYFANRDVNLIGHSMGGLDARYVISHLENKNYRVRSLTTIATPHRGSPFMDWCRDTLGLGHDHVPDVVSYLTPKQYTIPFVKQIDKPAFSNLTTDYCHQFNKVTNDDPGVYYASYAAKADVKLYHPLSFSSKIVKSKEGDNDGLVSVTSAKWGDFQGIVECDHWDLVPSKVRVMKKFDHVQFYLSVATKLARMGF